MSNLFCLILILTSRKLLKRMASLLHILSLSFLNALRDHEQPTISANHVGKLGFPFDALPLMPLKIFQQISFDGQN